MLHPPQDFGPRRLFIFRHAERVDVTFGKQWIQLSFDTNGCYYRRNLNMLKEIPKRKGGPSDFMKDSPITETGFFQSRLTGEGTREQGIQIQYIYCSPALRCVQTANTIIQGLQDPSIKLRIENGLFEWLAWCRGSLPTFMTPAELSKCGLIVDTSYVSQVALQRPQTKQDALGILQENVQHHPADSEDDWASFWQRDVYRSHCYAGGLYQTASWSSAPPRS